MPLPDNRLRLPSTRIDFETEVGTTGQSHDDWPSAGVQPRYDWMRIWLISLLSNQSSYEAPTEYRQGTLWYDLTNIELKIYNGEEWVSVSDVIKIGDSSLSDLFELSETIANTLKSDITFSGHCGSRTASTIPIPDIYVSMVESTKMIPMIYVNGVLRDPRLAEIRNGNMIHLSEDLVRGNKFTVVLQNVNSGNTYASEIVV